MNGYSLCPQQGGTRMYSKSRATIYKLLFYIVITKIAKPSAVYKVKKTDAPTVLGAHLVSTYGRSCEAQARPLSKRADLSQRTGTSRHNGTLRHSELVRFGAGTGTPAGNACRSRLRQDVRRVADPRTPCLRG